MGFAYFEKSGYSVDWLVAVAAGEIPGFSILDKFGHSEGAGTIERPIWGKGNADYTFAADPEGFRIYSDDNTATNTIIADLIDSDWGTSTGTFVLTGTTPVNMGTFLRCNRAWNEEEGRTLGILGGYVEIVGSGAIAAGTASAVSMVKARVQKTEGQTEQAIYSVPANQRLQVLGCWCGMEYESGNSASAMTVRLYGAGTNRPFRVRRSLGFNNLANNPAQVRWGVPLLFDPKSDIEMRVIADAVARSVSGGFYGLLIDV